MENTKRDDGNYVKIHMGDIEFYIFSDGDMSFKQPQLIFAPAVSTIDFETEVEKLHLRKDAIDVAINIMLVKKAGKIILIDAGMGRHFGDRGGRLLNNLENAGIPTDSITDIFITHAHRDHIGGLITTNASLIYPNAKYYMAKPEYDFWMAESPNFSNSKLAIQQIEETIVFTKKVLNTIKEKIILFTPGETLFSVINTQLAAGHTPGHTIFTLSSNGKSVKNIVDVFHTPLLITHPDWGLAFDVDFEQGIQTRTKILDDCYQNKTLIMSSHLPWPGLGYIDKRDNYYWSPLSFYSPKEINL